MKEVKRWVVTFDHMDGRKGTVEVVTEMYDSKAFQYGNMKSGKIIVGDGERYYDFRYIKGNPHMIMIEDFFGKGLVTVVER